MNKTLKAALRLAGILLLIPASAALAEMNEGNWEITTKLTEMKLGDMTMNVPPSKGETKQQCLTNKDFIPAGLGSLKNEDCILKDQKFSGGKGSWTMHCEFRGGDSSDSAGEITFNGDSFTGKVLLKTTPKGKESSLHTSTMSGKRIGPCKK